MMTKDPAKDSNSFRVNFPSLINKVIFDSSVINSPRKKIDPEKNLHIRFEALGSCFGVRLSLIMRKSAKGAGLGINGIN